MTEASAKLEPPLPRKLDFDSLVSSPFRLGAIGVAISLLFSILRLWLDPVINPDAVYYLIAAEAWIESGVGAALEIYWRPFYSILIGTLALVSGFSTLASAHLIDAVFAATLLVALQMLIRELGGDLRIQGLGLVLFLLLPSLHEYRTMIGRDLGYWAAAMLGLVALIRYARSGQLAFVGLFDIAVLIAMLFRPEAVVLLLLPLTLCIRRGGRDQLRAVMIAQVPLLFAGSMLAVGALVSEQISEFSAGLIQESLREPLRLLDTVPDRFTDMRDAFAGRVLHAEFHDFAMVGLIAGIVAIVASHFTVAISWPVLLIALFGFRRESFKALDPAALRLAIWTIGVVITMLCVFLIIRPVMQTRFLMLPAFIVLALVPFAFQHIQQRARQSGRLTQLRWITGVIVAYLAVEAWCSMENSKDYLLDAVDLVRQEAPADAKVLSNDARIAYLSGGSYRFSDLLTARHIEATSARKRRSLEADYDYWAVHLRAGSQIAGGLLDNLPAWREIGRTENPKGDQVIVLVSPRRDDGKSGHVEFARRPPATCLVCCMFGFSKRICPLIGPVGTTSMCRAADDS